MISVSLSEEKAELEPVLSRLGVYLKRKDFEMDIKPLIKLVLGSLLGDMTCFTDHLVTNFPHTRGATKQKVEKLYQNTGENYVL